jgi:hypothetical protein
MIDLIRGPRETYEDFISRVRVHLLTSRVKLKEIADNLAQQPDQ